MSEEKYLSFYRENAECDVACEFMPMWSRSGSRTFKNMFEETVSNCYGTVWMGMDEETMSSLHDCDVDKLVKLVDIPAFKLACEKAKINMQTGSINRMLDIFNAVVMGWCMWHDGFLRKGPLHYPHDYIENVYQCTRQRMDFLRTNVLASDYDLKML